MSEPRVERLAASELDLIRPLLVDLNLLEQTYYAEHPQLSRAEVESGLGGLEPHFVGENVILCVREADGARLAGFCWVVLFDPGTGLEGEVAEVFVAEDHRQEGVGRALLAAAVAIFEERGVTLGYVWTRAANEAATALYQHAGFSPTKQVVMSWYPTER